MTLADILHNAARTRRALSRRGAERYIDAH